MKYFLVLILSVSTAQAKSFKSMVNSFIKEQSKTTTTTASSGTSSSNSGFVEIQNPPEGNHQVRDFNHAKKIFKDTHYLGATKTAYCGCPMTSWNTFTNKGCGYVNEKYADNWHKIEAEHALPLSKILENTQAYKQGHPSCGSNKGRKCVEKIYGFIAGDLWIVAFPAETELNRVHSNYQWEELGSKGKQFGTCDFYYADKKVQPPKHLKGTIARTYMYVQSVYKVKVISDKNKKLFDIWAAYAPTPDQCVRAKNIVKYQGNENKFEIDACKKANLW